MKKTIILAVCAFVMAFALTFSGGGASGAGDPTIAGSNDAQTHMAIDFKNSTGCCAVGYAIVDLATGQQVGGAGLPPGAKSREFLECGGGYHFFYYAQCPDGSVHQNELVGIIDCSKVGGEATFDFPPPEGVQCEGEESKKSEA